MADTERTIRKRGELSLPVLARLPRYNRVDDTSLVIVSMMISMPNPQRWFGEASTGRRRELKLEE